MIDKYSNFFPWHIATSSTLDNDSKEEYFKATNLYNIPSENIRDMTQTGNGIAPFTLLNQF